MTTSEDVNQNPDTSNTATAADPESTATDQQSEQKKKTSDKQRRRIGTSRRHSGIRAAMLKLGVVTNNFFTKKAKRRKRPKGSPPLSPTTANATAHHTNLHAHSSNNDIRSALGSHASQNNLNNSTGTGSPLNEQMDFPSQYSPSSASPSSIPLQDTSTTSPPLSRHTSGYNWSSPNSSSSSSSSSSSALGSPLGRRPSSLGMTSLTSPDPAKNNNGSNNNGSRAVPNFSRRRSSFRVSRGRASSWAAKSTGSNSSNPTSPRTATTTTNNNDNNNNNNNNSSSSNITATPSNVNDDAEKNTNTTGGDATETEESKSAPAPATATTTHMSPQQVAALHYARQQQNKQPMSSDQLKSKIPPQMTTAPKGMGWRILGWRGKTNLGRRAHPLPQAQTQQVQATTASTAATAVTKVEDEHKGAPRKANVEQKVASHTPAPLSVATGINSSSSSLAVTTSSFGELGLGPQTSPSRAERRRRIAMAQQRYQEMLRQSPPKTGPNHTHAHVARVSHQHFPQKKLSRTPSMIPRVRNRVTASSSSTLFQ